MGPHNGGERQGGLSWGRGRRYRPMKGCRAEAPSSIFRPSRGWLGCAAGYEGPVRRIRQFQGRRAAVDQIDGYPVRLRQYTLQFGASRLHRHADDGADDVTTGLSGSSADGRTPRWAASGTVDDIAYGVLFLASEESSFMTGSELVIDGGWTAQ